MSPMTSVSRAPGPSVLNVLRGLRRDPTELTRRAARTYGDVVFLPIPGDPTYVAAHPDLAGHVLLGNHRNYLKGRLLKGERAFLGSGLLSNDGESWFAQRRMMQPAFHHRRVAAYGQTMIDFTGRMLDTWRDGETRPVQDDMMRLTLEIVVQTLFGAQDVDGERRTGAALSVVMDRFSDKLRNRVRLPDWVPSPSRRRYDAAIADLDAVVNEIVATRRASGERGDDLLGMLLEARDEDTGEGMDDRQLRDELVTMFVAGHETTAQTLAFTLFLLGTHPEVLGEVLSELGRVLGGRPPTLADLPHLTALDAVIKEAMRLYPAAPTLVREAIGADELAGYRVPAGSTVLVPVFALHRDGRFYDDPDTFRPGRWSGGLEGRLPKFAYLPFGGGPRVCIGNSFAAMELRLILASVLGRFTLEPVSGEPPELVSSITLRARGGLPMRVRARRAGAGSA